MHASHAHTHRILNGGKAAPFTAESLAPSVSGGVGPFSRSSKFMQQPIFNSMLNEHDMLRYVHTSVFVCVFVRACGWLGVCVCM
jgi:hypothetical protein